MKLKAKPSHLLLCGVSCCVGVYAGWLFGHRNVRKEVERASWLGRAAVGELNQFVHDAYTHENPEVGIWALERLIVLLEHQESWPALRHFFDASYDSEWGRQHYGYRAVTQARLGLRLQAAHRFDEADEQFRFALENERHALRTDNVTIQELIEDVRRVDVNRAITASNELARREQRAAGDGESATPEP